jgi:hypothetical protein
MISQQRWLIFMLLVQQVGKCVTRRLHTHFVCRILSGDEQNGAILIFDAAGTLMKRGIPSGTLRNILSREQQKLQIFNFISFSISYI